MAEPERHFLEHMVAELMAERVVDGLGVVQVEDHHAHRAVFSLDEAEGVRQPLREHQPVGKLGQCVMECAMRVDRRLPSPGVDGQHGNERQRHEHDVQSASESRVPPHRSGRRLPAQLRPDRVEEPPMEGAVLLALGSHLDDRRASGAQRLLNDPS